MASEHQRKWKSWLLSGKTVLLQSYTLCRACKLAFVLKGTASTRPVLIVTFGVL